jgi:nucleotide-binding universal stress UspA family protein
VLVATDFTLDGDRAVRRAGRLPLAKDASLVLTHVLPTSLERSAVSVVTGAANVELDAARIKLAELLVRRGLPEVTIRTRVTRGDAATEIARAAQANGAELIVVGRGGSRLSGTFLGSTAQRVARNALLPVLLVRQQPVAPYRRVVLGFDLSADALRAGRLAVRLAGSPKAPIFAVHAYLDPRADVAPTLIDAVAKARWRKFAPVLAEQSRRVRNRLRIVDPARRWSLSFKGGDPRVRLVEAVAKKQADLLVVGSRSRRGLPRLVLGSVAEAVLNRASSDVLISPRRRWLR